MVHMFYFLSNSPVISAHVLPAVTSTCDLYVWHDNVHVHVIQLTHYMDSILT